MSMPTSQISVRNLTLQYKVRRSFFRHSYHTALSDVSFEVMKGETLGIIGGNGSGKSSLLRVLAGIYMPDGGKVVRSVKKISLLSLALGFDDELNGIDNALFGAMLLGYRKAEAKAQLPHIIEFSDLGAFMHEPVRTYSSGMLSRLAFSIAINLQPDVLLVDEVLSVGDEAFRQKAEAAMVNKIRSDMTTIFVSHAADQIVRLCDRAILIDKGKLIAEGQPQAIIEQYNGSLIAPA